MTPQGPPRPVGKRDSFAEAQFALMDHTVVQMHADLLKTLRWLLITPFPPKDRRKAVQMAMNIPPSFRFAQVVVFLIFLAITIERTLFYDVVITDENIRWLLFVVDTLNLVSWLFFCLIFRPENLLRFKILAKRLALSGSSFPEHQKSFKRKVRILLVVAVTYALAQEGIHLSYVFVRGYDLPPVHQAFLYIRIVDITHPLVVLFPLVLAQYILFHRLLVEEVADEIKRTKMTMGSGHKEQHHDSSTPLQSSGSSDSRQTGTRSLKKAPTNISSAILDAKQEVEVIMTELKTKLQFLVMAYIAVSILIFCLMTVGMVSAIIRRSYILVFLTSFGYMSIFVLTKVLYTAVSSLVLAKMKWDEVFEEAVDDEQTLRGTMTVGR